MIRRLLPRLVLVLAFSIPCSWPTDVRAAENRDLQEPQESGGFVDRIGNAWQALVDGIFGVENVGEADGAGTYNDGGDGGGAAPANIVVIDGAPAVRLEPEMQERAGIETTVLVATSLVPEISARGTVVDIQPLIALRDRYRDGLYETNTIDVLLAAAKVEHQRLSALYKDNANVALKMVQEAETAWRTRISERNRLWSKLNAIRDQALGAWGKTLVDALLEEDSPLIAALLARKTVLLLVALPPGDHFAGTPLVARLFRDGGTGPSTRIDYISPAIQAAGAMQGETHFFNAKAPGLRTGMRVEVRIEKPGDALRGVIVPKTAIVWGLGRAWAYVRIDDRYFVRRQVDDRHLTPAGLFVDTDFSPGESVVTSAAQILYAEEFRWQIRDEDDN